MDAVGDEMIDGEARLIKRYANRKLYDTRESRYVTLNQIAEYVRVGEDVQIIDNKTKEDLTNVTLAQIIYEQQRAKEPAAREARSLRTLIREGREKLLTTLLDGPVGKLVPRVEDAPEADPAPSDVEPAKEAPRKSAVPSPKEAFDELSRLADEHLRALLGGALDTVKQLQSEVQRLQQRIEELEGKLAARRDHRDKKPGDAE